MKIMFLNLVQIKLLFTRKPLGGGGGGGGGALSLGLKLIVFGTWKFSVETPRNYRGFQKLYFRPSLKSLKHILSFFVSFVKHNFVTFVISTLLSQKSDQHQFSPNN